MAAQPRRHRRAVRPPRPAPSRSRSTCRRSKRPPRGRTPTSTSLGGPDARRGGRRPPLARPSDLHRRGATRSTTTAPTSSRCRGSASDGTWPSDTGPIHGVLVGADSKALVWTKEPEFTDLGYEAPSDWASFMALADAIVADGRTPFCLGIESGGRRRLAGDGLGGDGRAAHRRAGLLRRLDRATTCRSTTRSSSTPSAPSARWCTGPGSSTPAPRQAAFRNFGDALLDFTEQPGACLMTPFPSFMPAHHRRRRRPVRRQLPVPHVRGRLRRRRGGRRRLRRRGHRPPRGPQR